MAGPWNPLVVLFDLDDTLFDHASAARAALTGVHDAHTCFAGRPFEAFEADHARCLEDLHRRVMLGEIGIDDARMERFRRLFADAGVDASGDLLRDVAARYRRAYLDARQPVAGARDVLAALKPRVKVGVVSNNLLEEQQEKLRHCGFDPFVDALIVSEEAGVAKPDPAIFAIALERLGATADEAVMIGDSWSADVEGAQAAGIRPIWFNPLRHPPQQEGVAVLESFLPVRQALAAIFGSAGAMPTAGADVAECQA